MRVQFGTAFIITLDLTGTTWGGDHPSHIHTNTTADGAAITIDLSNVDRSTGMSDLKVQGR